jgi:hypothetical protein
VEKGSDRFLRETKRPMNNSEQNDQGIQPLYRDRNWNREERRRNKTEKRNNWFKKRSDSEAVMFVDSTPNEELAKRCRDVFVSHGFNIKVVERNNSTIKRTLVKSNPFKENGCQKMSCNLCNTGSKVNCKTREVVYKITCAGENNEGENCRGIEYVGETSRSMAERFGEHSKMLNSACEATRKKSFLHHHVQSVHNGNVPPLDVTIVGKCVGDPSMRQALEAVTIRREDPMLNRKQEWNNEPRKRKSKQGMTSNTDN